MTHRLKTAARPAAVVAALVIAHLAVVVPAASAAAGPKKYSNCTALHARYPHGVGRAGARDHISSSSRPVSSFTRDTATYSKNASLDRDHDGIACEKR
jgi:hypothetical protein